LKSGRNELPIWNFQVEMLVIFKKAMSMRIGRKVNFCQFTLYKLNRSCGSAFI
jgi:hypothetical protein